MFQHSYKNIERHTAHTVVSWPNPKQWVIVHTSDLMMIIRQSINILSIITTGMGKLKTHSSTYCILDNGEKYLILLTHSTKYIWQEFYKFNVILYINHAMTLQCRSIIDGRSSFKEYSHPIARPRGRYIIGDVMTRKGLLSHHCPRVRRIHRSSRIPLTKLQ